MINCILYPATGSGPLKQTFNIYSGKSSGVLWRLLTKSAFHLALQNLSVRTIFEVCICVKLLTLILHLFILDCANRIIGTSTPNIVKWWG